MNVFELESTSLNKEDSGEKSDTEDYGAWRKLKVDEVVNVAYQGNREAFR